MIAKIASIKSRMNRPVLNSQLPMCVTGLSGAPVGIPLLQSAQDYRKQLSHVLLNQITKNGRH
ncbi:MAG TPA: hypothetical protein VLH08_17930 [Acidobacteriota bacterium]|nr:hypothetical protein [Acidobacteriota bacterium]